MARLVLFLVLFAALVLAIAAALAAWRVINARPAGLGVSTEGRMPNSIRNVAYVVLLLLLVGITSGWLGPN
jgi:hypothetical protein